MPKKFASLLVLLIGVICSTSAQTKELPDFTDLVEKQGAAVVNISTTQIIQGMQGIPNIPEDDPFYEFFKRFAPQIPREQESQSLGSGFILSSDGYIMTNAHVVDHADKITVRLTDKREFRAKVIGADRRTDVALLKIDATGLPKITVGDPNKLKVGEWVVAIGSPFGFDNSVTAGIVSAKGRSLPQDNFVPYIQTDVAINPGNSGGPLFNMNEEVVGINSQIYTRSGGFFAGSELSAYSRAADARERSLLQPYLARLPADIVDGSYRLPVSDGSGRDRGALRAALALLAQAGYVLDGNLLRQRGTRTPLAFEILVTTRDQERVALAYGRDLKRAGIIASVRSVDGVQFDQRRLSFDFDMIQNRWDQSLSPGNEQSFYWGTEAADLTGTRNYMGARDPAIDAMIAAMLVARDRPDFVSAVRALDRVLMSGFYAIPLYHVGEQWIARWNRIERPAATALTGYLPETWWHRPDRK